MRKTTLVIGVLVILSLIGWITWLSEWYTDRNNTAVLTGGERKYDEVKTEEIDYFEGVKGYLSQPKEAPPAGHTFPGVVMIHDRWGLSEDIKGLARQLASEGYMVIAVDLFKGKHPVTGSVADKMVADLDQDRVRLNVKMGLEYLKRQGARKIASVGWGFGGTQSVLLALAGEPLAGTVTYYGIPTTDPARLAAIRWPVLAIFASQDEDLPVGEADNFRKSLNGLGIENYSYIYPNVAGGFADPSSSTFKSDETKDAWAKVVAFLSTVLR